MTEDDTFRVLRKTPINEVHALYYGIDDVTWNRMTNKDIDNFFESHGWTYHEYLLKRQPMIQG